ncbi:type II toxin-antitoxin system PemK/MazF family toxin [Vreelandella lionensis]|uniref:Type II toxin-antitoxin system PemK/MazF family toxin n=1 Tax=Vreelandella lionensis TaxID=1144478 RepID=A0ABW8BTP0_9GAMM
MTSDSVLAVKIVRETKVPIQFHPKKGQMLLCDFSQGFKDPEMTKDKRPVIVLSNSVNGRANLVTVVACSTVEPNIIQPDHMVLPARALPMLGRFQGNTTWVKGDMIYTVGFHRLNLIQLSSKHPTTGKRQHHLNCFGRETMNKIHECVLHGMNLGHLAAHL